MRTIFQRRYNQDLNFHPDFSIHEETISTLLIPEFLIAQLEISIPQIKGKKRNRKDWKTGLSILIEKYRGYLAMGNLPFSPKPKTLFQENGLNLKKFSFRPRNEDWLELGILADGLGVSRCWLFSYFLFLELHGLGEFLSIPPIKKGVTTPTASRPLKTAGFLKNRTIFRRVLHFRV